MALDEPGRELSLDGVLLGAANLCGTNLTSTNLSRANVQGANFHNATWINTTCPDGTNSYNNVGDTCIGHL